MPQKLGRVVIKEELVALTGDYKLAIVLNQMLYWSERVADFDKFISEEKERLEGENLDSSNLEYRNGWIYKKADELAEECMITSSEATMRRYLDKLVEKGWLSKRTNPKYRWDKTLQYRVNIHKLQRDLQTLGYFLEGYAQLLDDGSITQNDDSDFQNDDSNFQIESSNFQNDDSDFHNERSNFHGERAIPKTTSETTTEITSDLKEEVEERACEDSKQNPFSFFEQNGFGTLSPYVSEKIATWCSDLSDELVIEALKIGVENGSRNWKYVETILRDWANKGLTTVEQVHAAQLAFREKRSKQRGSSRKVVRKEAVPTWIHSNNHQQEEKLDKQFEEEKRQLEERIQKYKQQKRANG